MAGRSQPGRCAGATMTDALTNRRYAGSFHRMRAAGRYLMEN
jgi:hypothetical protein